MSISFESFLACILGESRLNFSLESKWFLAISVFDTGRLFPVMSSQGAITESKSRFGT